MPPTRSRVALILFAPCLLAAACSTSESGRSDSAAGAVAPQVPAPSDSAGTGISASTPADGGVAMVTPTDAKAVTKATEYLLTEDNFRRFLAASDSLLTLRARDPQARQFLDRDIDDTGLHTGVTTNNAGRKHLEAYPPVQSAIVSTGMSVRDYFVASIAVAQAERFMANPAAAPPTPALGRNAEFLNRHRAELQALHARMRSAGATH